MDILATAIGKPDHPGRVRGESKTIGLTQYFGRASPTAWKNQLSQEILSQVEEKVRQDLQRNLRAELLDELREEMKSFVTSSMQSAQSQGGQTNQVCN